MRIRLIGIISSLACLLAVGCATAPPSDMTERQVCRDHYSNDPVLRSQCDIKPADRDNAPRDVRPQDLPVQTNSPGG
jgi:hypothetical protein